MLQYSKIHELTIPFKTTSYAYVTHLGILLGELPELDAGGPRVAEDLQEFQVSRGHAIS